MDTRRVVVTGVGVVSPLGLDVERHWSRLVDGESAVATCERAECRTLPQHLGALVTGFDRRDHIEDRVVRKLLSPSGAYPVAAAGEAIRGAGLEGDPDLLARCGLYVGSLAFDIPPDTFIPAIRESFDREGNFQMSRFATRGMRILDPLFLVKALPNGGLCGVSIQYQVLGSNTNITNGPVSGLQAVAAACAAVRRGEVDVALAGAYDSLVNVDGIVEHLLAGRLSQRLHDAGGACRPFDAGRDGFVVGEGAAFVLLESESHARKRSAPIHAEVVAISQTSHGHLLRGPGENGGRALEQAARQALARGDCPPERLAAIFGDGLATEGDDLREAGVVERLVGDSEVAFTAATGAQGYTGAASGLFSLVHGALALRDGVVPPLTNCEDLDPRCRVHASPRGRNGAPEEVLIWQSDRDIKNAAVLLRACNG